MPDPSQMTASQRRAALVAQSGKQPLPIAERKPPPTPRPKSKPPKPKVKTRGPTLPSEPAWLDGEQPGTALVPVAPQGPMLGFSAFDASDYTVKVEGSERYLTVSPLRAVMNEQRQAPEHVVTERTRQGVLYGAGLGMEASVLARIMGLSLEELQTLYEDELATAPHLMMSDIQTNLYTIARDPNHSQSVRAGTYLLGKLGNKLYRDEQKLSSLAVRPDTRTVDVSLLSSDQRDALKDILLAAMRLAGQGSVVDGEYDEIEDQDNGEDLL